MLKTLLYDYVQCFSLGFRTTTTSGQSPGVKRKMPLHVVHSIDMYLEDTVVRYLRLYVRRSVVGWGVSIWQLDVYGNEVVISG